MKINVKTKKDMKDGVKEDIGIKISSYDDIFSDFDPRPFVYRGLSDDFLLEIEKASKVKGNKVDLVLMMPSRERIANAEGIIKKRLKDHFKKHTEVIDHEYKGMITMSSIFVLVGLILMIIGALIIFKKFMEGTFIASLLIVVLEPAGWFFFWEGLRHAIFDATQKKPELVFYKKMSAANIEFVSS